MSCTVDLSFPLCVAIQSTYAGLSVKNVQVARIYVFPSSRDFALEDAVHMYANKVRFFERAEYFLH